MTPPKDHRLEEIRNLFGIAAPQRPFIQHRKRDAFQDDIAESSGVLWYPNDQWNDRFTSHWGVLFNGQTFFK